MAAMNRSWCFGSEGSQSSNTSRGSFASFTSSLGGYDAKCSHRDHAPLRARVSRGEMSRDISDFSTDSGRSLPHFGFESPQLYGGNFSIEEFEEYYAACVIDDEDFEEAPSHPWQFGRQDSMPQLPASTPPATTSGRYLRDSRSERTLRTLNSDVPWWCGGGGNKLNASKTEPFLHDVLVLTLK